jgi:transcriptional regulator with GAF, ATPase, and Fis domain
MPSELIVVSGPVKGTRFVLTQDDITIGRHSSNVFCIGDPSVSRSHCIIRARDGGYSISDLGSNNGTWVAGVPAKDYALKAGDQIKIGDTVIKFTTSAADDLVEEDEPRSLSHPTLIISREEARQIAAEALSSNKAGNERATKQLRAMLAVGSLLSCSNGMETFQRRLIEAIADVVPADSGAVVLAGYHPTDNLSTVKWRRTGAADGEVTISQTLLKRVLREGTPVLWASSTLPDELSTSESLITRRVHSAICVPLVLNDAVHGVLYFEAHQATLDDDDLRLVTAVAGYATLALDHARRMEALQAENRYLQSQAQIRHNMVGESPAMRALYERIRKFAQTDATVLITGESGTGKELTARALHQNSGRAGKPFWAINCALLRENLLESELFGHEKGAFTGANALKRGKLELAHGGTVFLDEIGELAEAPQAMLLRVLQERQFTRVGGSHPINVDIRLVAATNRDLEEAVRNKTFREDLYYRLHVVCLRVPPLRERREDILMLAQHFVRQSATRNKRAVTGISPAATTVLLNYAWPGNVRELENVMEHAVVFGSGDEILPEDLPELLLDATRNNEFRGGYHDALHEAKCKIVLDALRTADWNYAAAAQQLGIHANNLHRLIRQLNLKPRITPWKTEMWTS